MSRYISDTQREIIADRAFHRCEYCLIPEANAFYAFQVDHIISLKHGGLTELENLAYSCSICNRNKGSDLGTFLENPEEIIRFFNPRKDQWINHFRVTKAGLIHPRTPIGAATIKIFGFNHPDSIVERKLLISIGEYP